MLTCGFHEDMGIVTRGLVPGIATCCSVCCWLNSRPFLSLLDDLAQVLVVFKHFLFKRRGWLIPNPTVVATRAWYI
jgi:hypothetical protein